MVQLLLSTPLVQKVALSCLFKFWTTVEVAIDNLDVHHEGLKLYQDGLPVCNKEKDIISDLAARGSLNHRLLVRLIDKGAIIMGTESPELLLEEYVLTKDMITSSNTSNAARIVRQKTDLSESLRIL